MRRRDFLVGSTLVAFTATGVRAQAEKFSGGIIRLGILNDRSGPYADVSGVGSEISARMAAEQFGNKLHGVPIEIIAADHQNKPDVGVAIARKWFDVDGVDVIFDITNSAVSLALNGLVAERKKLVIHNSGSSDITGKACTARAIQWQYTAWAAASNVVTKEMVEAGMNTFFILAVDYALGEATARPFREAVKRAGGSVVGEVRHPLNTNDFSSYILQAQASGAKAVMLANAGADLANSIKQAREFGLTPGVQLLAGALTKDVIAGVGLEVMQGLQTVSWYEMYRDPASIDWARQFSARHKGKTPTELQASTYSAVLNYLRAVDAIGTDDADAVIGELQKMTFNDSFASNGHLRPDGIMAHDMYLVRLKAPKDSMGPGDYSIILTSIPGDRANIPLADSVCPLVHRQ